MPDTLSTEQLFGAEPSRRILRNGLTVLFSREPSAGLVSAQVWVKTGSIHEGALLGSGLSHYLEHLVFKGTKKYSCSELAKVVQAAGATMNAYTTFDRTVFHIDGPSECAELALDVLAEMTLRPLLDPEDAAREREVILREIDMYNDDPDSVLFEALLREVVYIHPTRFPVIGLRDAFAALTHQQVLDYHKARYAPNNLVLIVAGTLEEESVFAWAEKYFGSAPAGAIGAPNVPTEPDQLAARSASLDSNVKVLRGCMAWRIPGMRHPDSPALDVFSMLLGLGESSRLHRRLHDELALVHGIGAHNWLPGVTGMLWCSYTADPGRRAEIESAVLEVVETLLRDGLYKAEFDKARRACLMAFLENRKTISRIASQLGLQAIVIGDLGYPRRYLERIHNLTPNDVLEAARRHILRDKLTCVAMEPQPAPATGGAPGTASASAFNPFSEVRFENGLRILLQPAKCFPKVNFRIMFPGGGTREPDGKRGLCALLGTMLTRDTETRTAGEVAEAAEVLGASLLDSAGNNSFGLSIEVLRGDVSAGIGLLADAVLNPALAERTFQLERDDQISTLQEGYDDVLEYGHRRLREIFFGAHPLAVSSLGTQNSLEKMTPVDVRSLYAAIVRPRNTIIAVSGDFDQDAVMEELNRYFLDWHAVPPPQHDSAASDVSTPALPARAGRVDETRDCGQALVFLAFPDIGITSQEYIVGQLLDDLLTGMASRLFISVREERGLAYFIGSNRVSSLKEGMFYLYAGTAPQHVETVLLAMQEEIQRAREGLFSDADIASSKARLRTNRRMAAQSLGVRTLNASLNALYGMDVNRDAFWEAQLEAQNNATIAAFAAKYLRAQNSLAYVLTPKGK
ncbi:MAG: insulinase family protein [Puniceicoccales bacterium]|jgi:zinc protease|nr:insulinase family protein [Puniceicoccales bacterium]